MLARGVQGAERRGPGDRRAEGFAVEASTTLAAGEPGSSGSAPTKVQVMLQFCGIGRDVIDFAVDKSGLRQGRLTPGTHIPITGPEALLTRRPDVMLLCAWNCAEEIRRQQKEYLDQGGRLLHSLPMPHYM